MGFSIFLGACKGSKTQSETCEVTPVENEHSLLWEITGKDLKKKSYLFGTIHLIDSNSFFMGEGLLCRFNAADTLVMELSMDLEETMAAMEKAVLDNDQTLEDVMSPEEYSIFKNYVIDSLGINEAMFNASMNNLKPFFAWQQASMAEQMKSGKSYELKFLEMANKAEKPILGLETAMEQMSFFDSISIEEQVKMTIQGIREFRQDEKELQELIDAYTRQEMETLYALMHDSSPEFMEYEDIFLTNRNKNWISKIEDMVSQSSVFIAVGAGHLGGPNGVVKLLKEAGYTLTPVATE